MIDTITTEVLEQHQKWLADEPGGEKLVTGDGRIKVEANLRGADLRGADLRGANLRGADLSGADLDFAAWPLWCGSNHVKADARIAAAFTAWMMVDTAASHAAARHAAVAESVRTCMGPDQMNALQKWYNPTTGRSALLCQLDNGKFGLVVGYKSGDLIREVSAFLKNKFRRLSQVERYLQNAGYQRVK